MKSWATLWRFNQVLTGLQISTVFVRENLVALLVTKLTHTPRPFSFPAGSLLKLLAFNDASDVFQQKILNPITPHGIHRKLPKFEKYHLPVVWQKE